MIRIITICFFLQTTYAFSQSNSADSSSTQLSDNFAVESRYDSLLTYAKQYIGIKYKYQGTTKNGFDCSGFVQHVFAHYNKKLPHASTAQALIGEEIQLKNLQKGDLVFFKGRSLKSKKVGHVGIVMEANNGHFKMIHASVHKGVTIDYFPEGEYYKKRYLTARRISFE
ncbi:MAG: C40 family peptidase [Bacteroidota bacterium]